MLESYFQHQKSLVESKSFLKCPPDCNAPGCWMSDVIVEVNLFDLIRLHRVCRTSVSALFFNYCNLGLQTMEINPRYYQLTIKLKKPCRFLDSARCTVHGSKPLNCVLFPEYQRIIGHWAKLAGSRIFRKFPCVNNELMVSDERRRALKELRRMSLKEEALSYYFLTGLPCFVIDSKPLARCLKHAGPQNRALTLKDYDKLFDEQLKSTGLLDGVIDKIFQLDTRQGRDSLFEKLCDNTMMAPLLEESTAPKIVHYLKKNCFKPLKRSLKRPEVAFM